ncbi:MAG: hypothetical protein O7A69_02890 [SAR324 cluster bacterium]|nr:hypothetical protein [SAR324 cluster bacterium]
MTKPIDRETGKRQAPPPLIWLVALMWILAACSPHVKLYPKIEGLTRQGKFIEAAKLVEKNRDKYAERNAVLYNLDRGLLYHYGGDYESSNRAFAAAEARMDELFTTSIAGEAGAFLSNDNTLPYRGEDFEAVTINIYRALNYLKLGDTEAALVEARKVNEKLEYINSNYPPDKRNVYKEDGFARLLAGILYELGGTRDDLNDAYISNRMALENYRGDFFPQYGVDAPALLAGNLLTTAAFMGREELEQARKAFPNSELIPLRDLSAKGRLYFVHFAGRSPIKIEGAIHATMPDGYLMKIAFPVYKRRGYTVTGSKILVNGREAIRLEAAEPIGSIAVKNLENRKLRIKIKAVARATTKYLATLVAEKAVKKRQGEMAALLTRVTGNVLAAVSEQADLRSWETLPDKILVGRVLVAPGKHRISAHFTNAGGGVVARKDLGSVEIKPGQALFFILYTNY